MYGKMEGCPFCEMTAADKKYLLDTVGNWQVFLADKQDYIGRCIVVHKQHLEYLSDASVQDFVDFTTVVRELELALEQVFDATLFNWSCLMNDAYKRDEFMPHLHIHLRPRYQDPVRLFDSLYDDEEFGHHYDNHKEDKLTAEEKNEVFKRLYCYLHGEEITE